MMSRLSAVAFLSNTSTTFGVGCRSSMDCSLNGDCVDGVCCCDAPWSGGTCETMRFKPVKEIQGYGMQPNLTTWGGGAIFDGSRYHLYVSAMTNECPLSTWQHNSRIDHAIAENVVGPYSFVDVAVNTWSHNAAPVALADNAYAIFHIGNGDGPRDGGSNCSQGVLDSLVDVKTKVTAGSSIHVSQSLDGPWTPLSPNTLGSCNNPAPWVHPNGTIYIVCGGILKRAENISGPWTSVTGFSHDGGPAGIYEDPVLYTDKRGFHVFYHVYNYADREQCVDATVSAHIFSEDGYTWRASPKQPFGTQIEVEGGETVTVSTRERPKLFFDEFGQMTHLFNGVCYATQCPSEKPCVDCKYTHWDYTLAQPLDLSPPTPAPFPPSPPALALLNMADCEQADRWAIFNVSVPSLRSPALSELRTGSVCLALNNGELTHEACGQISDAERFEITDWTQGYFRIKEPSETQCVQSFGGSATAGAKVAMYSCSAFSDGIDKRGNEYWQLSDAGELLSYRSDKAALTCISRLEALKV